MQQFDAAQRDVGVYYAVYAPDAKIVVTLYVYPRPASGGTPVSLDQIAPAEVEEVTRRHAPAVTREPALAPPSPGGAAECRGTEFSYEDVFSLRRQPLSSFLWVCLRGERLVKYRITFPVGDREAALPAIRDLLAQWTWLPEP